MWIDEVRMYLKLNEDCSHKYKLSSRVVIQPYLNLNELIYRWNWKTSRYSLFAHCQIAVNWYRIAVWLVNMTVGLDFQIVGLPLTDVGSPLASREFLFIVGEPLTKCRIAVNFQRLIFPSAHCRRTVNRCRIAVSVQRLIFNSACCRRTVNQMSDRR